MRHGEAAPPGSEGGDRGRPLTQRGTAEVAAAARGLAALGVRLDRLLTSPLRRALETSRLLAAAIEGPEPEPSPVLDGGSSAEAILAALGPQSGAGARLGVVGHQPVLGQLLTLAIAGVASGGAALGTASVARIDFEGCPRAGAGRLRWLLDAGQLARLAAG